MVLVLVVQGFSDVSSKLVSRCFFQLLLKLINFGGIGVGFKVSVVFNPSWFQSFNCV